ALDCSHQAAEVLRFDKHRDAGHSCGAGIKRLPKVREINAAESQNRNAHTARNLVQRLDSNRFTVLFLTRSLEHRSEDYEVRAALFRRSHIIECVSRYSDQCIRPESRSHHLDSQRASRQMYTRSGARVDVSEVIDQDTR